MAGPERGLARPNGTAEWRRGTGRGRLPALLGALAIAGCAGPPSPDVDIRIMVSPTPAAVGPARVLVTIRDSVGAPVDGASVEVVGTPQSARDGSTRATARGEGDGVYVVAALGLPRPGPWTLTAFVALPDGRSFERRVPLTVVAPPAGSRRPGGSARSF